MFRDVRQKLEYTIRKKRNWMQEQSVDISLVIQQSEKGICFTVLPIAQELLNLEIKEVRVQVPLTSTSISSTVVPNVVEPLNDDEEQQINDHEANNEHVVEQPQEIKLRRSQRERR